MEKMQRETTTVAAALPSTELRVAACNRDTIRHLKGN